MTITERFWAKVTKSDGCWGWSGARANYGYGLLCVTHKRPAGTRLVRAHRFSWELHFGPIPTGLQVLHRCDNTACVRPDHLFLGTQLENIADMNAKGRRVKAFTYKKPLTRETAAA